MTEHANLKDKEKIGFFERAPNPVKYAKQIEALKSWQKHHLVPCTSCKESINTASKSKEHLAEALKYFTKWNVNEKHNLIALPTRTTYQNVYGRLGAFKDGPVAVAAGAALGNLPCHQPTSWGHTVYNDKIERELAAIWAQVNIAVEAHKLEANDVGADLKAKSDEWRATFPRKRQATLENWKKALSDPDTYPFVHNNFTMVDLPESPI